MAGLLDDIGTNATGPAPGIDLQLGICMGISWGISGHTHTHTHQYPYPHGGYGYIWWVCEGIAWVEKSMGIHILDPPPPHNRYTATRHLHGYGLAPWVVSMVT